MALYKYLRQAWRSKTAESKAANRARLIQWRREPVTLRIRYATRLDRARSLGYKAKQGVLLVRQKVIRGGHKREKRWGGRRSKNMTTRMNLELNYQAIAERRAEKKFVNTEVMNSYYVGKDGKNIWYEVILVSRSSPVVMKDKVYSGIARQKGRAQRGLTSANRKSRGLRHKGKGAEKVR